MALLGKFFKGSNDRDDAGSSRSKRGRAPSIRTNAEGAPAAPAAPGLGLPEINLDEIDKARAAQAPAPGSKRQAAPIPELTAKPIKTAEKPPIDVGPAPAKADAPARPQPEKPSSPAAGGDAGKRGSRAQSRQKPIGELLIQAGSVSTEQLSRALKIQDKGGKGLVGQILVSMGACQNQAILAALNRQFRISTVELDRVDIPSSVSAMVPADKCREHRLMPFEKIGTILCVSMANCLNRKAINEIEELTKLKVKPFNSTWIDIRKAIENVAKDGPPAVAGAGDAPAPAAAEAEPQAATSDPSADSTAAPIEVADEPKDVAKPAEPEPVAEVAPQAAPKSPVAAAPEPAESAPFVGPAKARIEGLDTLDSTEAEVVQETERGLASKHLDEIRRRRTERQKLMGTGQGVVGKLVAPGLDSYRPEGDSGDEPEAAGDVAEPIQLRLVDEQLLTGAELPTATELAANLEAFKAAAAAPEPAPAPEPKAAAAEPATHPVETGFPRQELPAVTDIGFEPAAAPREAAAIRISDEEWAAIEADLEPDPVVAWQATYASAGPVPAAPSWL